MPVFRQNSGALAKFSCAIISQNVFAYIHRPQTKILLEQFFQMAFNLTKEFISKCLKDNTGKYKGFVKIIEMEMSSQFFSEQARNTFR